MCDAVQYKVIGDNQQDHVTKFTGGLLLCDMPRFTFECFKVPSTYNESFASVWLDLCMGQCECPVQTSSMGSIGLKTPYPAQGICDGFISSNFRGSIVKGWEYRQGMLASTRTAATPPPPSGCRERKKLSPLLSSPYSLLGRLDREKLMPLLPCRKAFSECSTLSFHFAILCFYDIGNLSCIWRCWCGHCKEWLLFKPVATLNEWAVFALTSYDWIYGEVPRRVLFHMGSHFAAMM